VGEEMLPLTRIRFDEHGEWDGATLSTSKAICALAREISGRVVILLWRFADSAIMELS